MTYCADNAFDHLYQCFTLLFPFSYITVLRDRLHVVIPVLERRKLRLIEVK